MTNQASGQPKRAAEVDATAADMRCPLLATKLYAPTVHPNLTPRPRVLAQLTAGLRAKVVVVAAPAGFGKTTLLAHWKAAADVGATPPVTAWVTLDAGDNDVRQFWRYIVAALQNGADGVGDAASTLLADDQAPLETVLTTLINAILARPTTFVLILDDYHLIEAPAVHESLTFLLDHLPENLHLAILSRSDPPLPLARLRLGGALTEIRAAALQFTAAETAAFLNQSSGLSLTPADGTALHTRTEGWITGLQAAALSLQGQPDPHAFIDAFRGTHRYLLDYLVEEVLQQQPLARQTFLLHTALLDNR